MGERRPAAARVGGQRQLATVGGAGGRHDDRVQAVGMGRALPVRVPGRVDRSQLRTAVAQRGSGRAATTRFARVIADRPRTGVFRGGTGGDQLERGLAQFAPADPHQRQIHRADHGGGHFEQGAAAIVVGGRVQQGKRLRHALVEALAKFAMLPILPLHRHADPSPEISSPTPRSAGRWPKDGQQPDAAPHREPAGNRFTAQ